MKIKQRASGVLLHPTALPSTHGIGDFGSTARDFIDFLELSGQSYWQVLPLGHTSFGDSPYQSLSSFAGNPLLISPGMMMEHGLLQSGDIEKFQSSEAISVLPDNSYVDYGTVISYKDRICRAAYDNFTRFGGKYSSEYKKFLAESKNWIGDYSFFVAYKSHLIADRKMECNSEGLKKFSLKMKKRLDEKHINNCYYGAAWYSWPDNIRMRDKHTIAETLPLLQDEIEYIRFQQFIFFQQWHDLKAYADSRGIGIIGDLPIFTALDSADVWSAVSLFEMDGDGLYPARVAGVPPDYFSDTGQLWGNPLYDWSAHEKTGYKWWIHRLQHSLNMFDIVRIDHFRGFEAYWAIESGEKTAVNGKWIKGPGKKFFDEIKKALGDELPIIAEDLGIITPRVEKLRSSLSLPGMKILQYSFDGDPLNTNRPHNFISSNTVVYTGTHDNDTTAGWYASSGEETKDRFRRYLNVSGDDPSWDMIRLAMLSVALLAVFPVQDILSLGTEARFNTPGTAEKNWRYRMKEGDLRKEHAERLKYLTELGDRIGRAVIPEKNN